MKVYIAGAFGSRRPNMNLSTFIIDDIIAIDCGALFSRYVNLDKIETIFLTHCHADHIKDLPFFVDVFPFEKFRTKPLIVYGNDEVLKCLKDFVFNGKIWPKIEKIRLKNDIPGVIFREIETFSFFKIKDYTVVPTPTYHTVKTNGFAIFKNGKGVMISGDTYRCDDMWNFLTGYPEIEIFFVDVSYPSEKKAISLNALHYNVKEFVEDVERFYSKEKVRAYHLKYPFVDKIKRELEEEGIFSVCDGDFILI